MMDENVFYQMNILTNIIPHNTVETVYHYETLHRHIACLVSKDVILKGILRGICVLNGFKKVYAIELKNGINGGTNGTFNDLALFECNDLCGILVDGSAYLLEIDERTGVILHYEVEDMVKETGQCNIGEPVLVNIENESKQGIITDSGKINEIFCYAVKLNTTEITNDIPQTCIVIESDVISLPETKKYPLARSSLESGAHRGIQGNFGSSFIDASLFGIFTFNLFLDDLFLDESDNKHVEELRNILKTDIVYSLRRSGYVGRKTISKFRDKLQNLSPDEQFNSDERDPEVFLERLFKLLTPEKYLVKISPLRDIIIIKKCFLTQLFCPSMPSAMNLMDMLCLTFVGCGILMNKPPKGLIMLLPPNGPSNLSQRKKVSIPAKIDITSFVIACPKRCHVCSVTSIECKLCCNCSLDRTELTYYCAHHGLNCPHNKNCMPAVDNPHIGDVVLELVSVLCIENDHYSTYVKTNTRKGSWIYFNSMETMCNGIFIPTIRETNLHKYFIKDSTKKISSYSDEDVEKIEECSYVCIYKNPLLECFGAEYNFKM